MDTKTSAKPPTEEDTRQTAALRQKGKQRGMGQPSWKLGLIVYLRRLIGKKLAGAIAINEKIFLELVPRALPINPGNTEANRHSEQDGRILKGR